MGYSSRIQCYFQCYHVGCALGECLLFLGRGDRLRRSWLGDRLKTNPEHRSARLQVKALDGPFVLLDDAVASAQT